MSGNFENTRERLEKSEQQIRKTRLDREREQCAADREQRERLERASPSGSRRSLISILNAGNAPDMDVVTRLRALEKLTAEKHNLEHARWLTKADNEQRVADDMRKLAAQCSERLDRLHPESALGRSGGGFDFSEGKFDHLGRSAMPVQDAGGSRSEARLLPERRRPDSGTRFDFHTDDPGNRQGSRFGDWSDYTPDLASAKKLLGVAGKMMERARSISAGGEVHSVEATFLLESAKQVIEAVNSRLYSQRRV